MEKYSVIKQVYEIDENGFLKETYVSEVSENGEILDLDKVDFISIDLPNGLYKAKWTGTSWEESLTQAEIDELNKPLPYIPTDAEILGQQMTEREIESMVQGQQITDMELRMMIIEMGVK